MSELLISASDANNQSKGEVVDAKPAGHAWGSAEQPPGYVHLTITEGDRAVGLAHARPWRTTFEHKILLDQPSRLRVQSRVHPQAISNSGMGRTQMRDDMVEWLKSDYGAEVINNSPTTILHDLPQPPAVDFALFVADFADAFDALFVARLEILPAATVDAALAGDGTLTMTQAQALAAFIVKTDL